MENVTLTGIVTEVQKTDKGDACLYIVVGGFEEYPLYCYWLQDAAHLQVGDTVTVCGTIKNYQDTIEFDHPELADDSMDGGSDSGETEYLFTDFDTDQKALFNEYFGETIPFIPNNEYYVDEYVLKDEIGLNFYTFGNTRSEFNTYLNQFSVYVSAGTDTDSSGNTWYYFDDDDYYIDLVYYYDSDYDDYLVDVYVYVLSDELGGDQGDTSDSSSNNSDSSSDSDDTDDSVGGTESTDLITNDGKGLPTAADGVHEVDFTKGKYVKTVADQGYYQGGCPTVGKPQVLVIPVEFKDVTAASKGYTVDKIEKAFNGNAGETDYRSVHDYYYASSYGKLDVQFTVLDFWFRPEQNSSYYLNKTMDYYGDEIECGDQVVINEFLSTYDGEIDFSHFDSDGNGMIDAVIVINTLEINYDVTMQWAYRYWNLYTDAEGYYYEYDGVSANDYLWASYQFMFENENGDFDDSSALSTYTYIHEFGHVLGADDYYDTSYSENTSPMNGHDIMDGETGDHNAYTKFNYGWLTSSRLIVAEESVTLSLESFGESGDTIIIANNWDDELGAYQEYFIVVYYKNDGLNNGFGYFENEGLVVYHVNASLYAETIEGETYYDVYNNNTDASDPDGYGTENNLIELVKNASDYVFEQGDSLSGSTALDNGEKIAYTFTVDALTEDSATVTFRKNE